MRKQLLLGAVAIVACAQFASAVVPWVPPSGTQGTFTYTTGQNSVGKFGSGIPNSDANGFDFFPSQFVASANGTSTPVTVSDVASVIIHGNGTPVLSITATFIGDYTIFGAGSVSASGLIKAFNLDTSAVAQLPLLVSGVPVSTTTSAQGGVFASATVNLPGGWENFRLEFTASLTATAGPNGTSLIQNKDSELIVRNKLIPEPTLAAIGLLGTMVRRSRR